MPSIRRSRFGLFTVLDATSLGNLRLPSAIGDVFISIT
jgi:hypothetical protein